VSGDPVQRKSSLDAVDTRGAAVLYMPRNRLGAAGGQQHLGAAVEADVAGASLARHLHVPHLSRSPSVLHDGGGTKSVAMTGCGDQIDLPLDCRESALVFGEAGDAPPAGAGIGQSEDRRGVDQTTNSDQVMVLQDHLTHHAPGLELLNGDIQTGRECLMRGQLDFGAELALGTRWLVVRHGRSGDLEKALDLRQPAVDE
jgi:hypothetical protein